MATYAKKRKSPLAFEEIHPIPPGETLGPRPPGSAFTIPPMNPSLEKLKWAAKSQDHRNLKFAIDTYDVGSLTPDGQKRLNGYQKAAEDSELWANAGAVGQKTFTDLLQHTLPQPVGAGIGAGVERGLAEGVLPGLREMLQPGETTEQFHRRMEQQYPPGGPGAGSIEQSNRLRDLTARWPQIVDEAQRGLKEATGRAGYYDESKILTPEKKQVLDDLLTKYLIAGDSISEQIVREELGASEMEEGKKQIADMAADPEAMRKIYETMRVPGTNLDNPARLNTIQYQALQLAREIDIEDYRREASARQAQAAAGLAEAEPGIPAKRQEQRAVAAQRHVELMDRRKAQREAQMAVRKKMAEARKAAKAVLKAASRPEKIQLAKIAAKANADSLAATTKWREDQKQNWQADREARKDVAQIKALGDAKAKVLTHRYKKVDLYEDQAKPKIARINKLNDDKTNTIEAYLLPEGTKDKISETQYKRRLFRLDKEMEQLEKELTGPQGVITKRDKEMRQIEKMVPAMPEEGEGAPVGDVLTVIKRRIDAGEDPRVLVNEFKDRLVPGQATQISDYAKSRGQQP